MIRHSNPSVTTSEADRFHQYDHLIPPAKRILKFTARATWFMMKTLVKTAIHIPTLLHKVTHTPKPPAEKLPSPATAFPAP